MKPFHRIQDWIGAALILASACPPYLLGQDDPPSWRPEKAEVMLPYSELKLLWDAASHTKKDPKEIPPPVDAVVRSLTAELTIGEATVRLMAQFEVESLSSGWHSIPLLGGSAPLIGVQPVDANVARQEDRYVILRKEPGIQNLNLEFAAPRQPGPREKLIELAPQNATVQILNVNGIPQDRTLEVNGKPVGSRDGVASLPLPQDGDKVQISLSAALPPAVAAAPSTWRLSTQAVLRYEDGALHHVMRLFAQDQSGNGQHLRLQLPDHARGIEIRSEGLANQHAVRGAEGGLSYELTWEEAGTLDRRVELTFDTAISPLAPEWSLFVPRTPEEGAVQDALYVVILSQGLEIEGPGVIPGSSAERISDWYLEQIGNASFVSLQVNADAVIRSRWLPRRTTAQATIREAHFETQLEKNGQTLNRATFVIEHESALTWQLKLPPGCEVLRCTANDRATKPVARDDSSIEMALTPVESKSRVEISYTHRGTALEPIEGSTILTLPQTPLFIHKLDWKLEIPEVFVIHAVDGNVEVSSQAAPSDGHTVLLTKALCQGESPSVEVFYNRRSSDKS